MTVELGHLIMMTIQTQYSGGQQQFVEDGGAISLVPVPGEETQVWVYHPQLPAEIESVLQQVLEGAKKTGIYARLFVRDSLAFEMEGTLPLMLALIASLEQLPPGLNVVLSPPSTSIVVFSMRENRLESEEVKKFHEALKSISYLNRASIVAMDGALLYEAGVETQAEHVDIEKLHEMLEKDMDVNDFINNL